MLKLNDIMFFNINGSELINKIFLLNSKEKYIQDLKIKLIEQFIIPNVEDKKLYKSYNDIEILNNIVKKSRKDKKILDNISKEEITKELNIKNTKIDNLKKSVLQNLEKYKTINFDENTSIVVNSNYNDLEFIITLNHQYLIVLCENTKLDVKDYKNKVHQIIKTNKEVEINDILEIDKKYINEDFEKNNVIYVVINNENKELETKYNDLIITRFNNTTLINVLNVLLKDYKNEKGDILTILKMVLQQLQIKERLGDNNIYKEIVKSKKIRIGEKFEKSYTCFNCFYDKINISKLYGDFEKTKYDEICYTQKATSKLKGSNNIEVWVADTTNTTNWGNIVKDNTLIEICNKEFDEIKEFKKIYRYTFVKKRDDILGNYIEFIGLYGIDVEKSKNVKRVWKRIEVGDEVPLDLEIIEKFINDIIKVNEENNEEVELPKKEEIKEVEKTKTSKSIKKVTKK